MPIDWFTVGAQVLNFLLLVWLMRRFLYQPVLDAIAAREQKIAAELADAAAVQADAHQQLAVFQQKNQAFDAQRAGLLQQARDAAQAEVARLQGDARAAAAAAAAAHAQALLSGAQRLRTEISRQAQVQVFAIARRVLDDLAAVSLEQRACEVFIQRLQALDQVALSTLGAALDALPDGVPAQLRSAFDLPAAQRAAIQAAADQVFGRPVALAFDTAPELVSGITLSAHGQKLAWSIADHLGALSSGLEDQLLQTAPA